MIAQPGLISVPVLPRRRDELGRVALPLPRRDGIAEDAFEKETESELAVVAVGEEDHAGLAALEADQVVLGAVAVAFFEKREAVGGAGEESPAGSVGETNGLRLSTFRLIGGEGELVEGADRDDRLEHFPARGGPDDFPGEECRGEEGQVVGGAGYRAGARPARRPASRRGQRRSS